MSMTPNMVKNILKISAYGKPFYASDLGLNGGEISGLACNNYIKHTGHTKTVMVQIDTWGGDRIYKECKAKEWEYRGDENRWMREALQERFIKAVQDAKEILAAAAELGIGGF